MPCRVSSTCNPSLSSLSAHFKLIMVCFSIATLPTDYMLLISLYFSVVGTFHGQRGKDFMKREKEKHVKWPALTKYGVSVVRNVEIWRSMSQVGKFLYSYFHIFILTSQNKLSSLFAPDQDLTTASSVTALCRDTGWLTVTNHAVAWQASLVDAWDCDMRQLCETEADRSMRRLFDVNLLWI